MISLWSVLVFRCLQLENSWTARRTWIQLLLDILLMLNRHTSSAEIFFSDLLDKMWVLKTKALFLINLFQTIVSIEEVLRNSLQSYEKHREKRPKRIILYRSGASEGSHASIIAYEVQLARTIIQEFGDDIKLIYIAVTKDHTYRFFNQVVWYQSCFVVNQKFLDWYQSQDDRAKHPARNLYGCWCHSSSL